jgi:hypothetical protein
MEVLRTRTYTSFLPRHERQMAGTELVRVATAPGKKKRMGSTAGIANHTVALAMAPFPGGIRAGHMKVSANDNQDWN